MELRENTNKLLKVFSRILLSVRNLQLLMSLLIIIVLISSCTGQKDSEHFSFINREDLPKIIPNHIRTVGSTSDFFFGDIIDVKILENGKIIVLDEQKMSVHLLSKDGAYEKNLEFRGRGPGEIQNLSKRLRIATDDIVAIDDYMMYKISLYQIIENKFDHLTDVALESSFENYFLKKDYKLILKRSGKNNGEKSIETIQVVDIQDHVEEEPILKFPAHEEIFLTANMGGLSLNLETSTEFHTRNIFCVEDNRLYHVRTDSLGFRVYDSMNGEKLFKFNYDQDPERLSLEEKESVIDSLLDNGSELWDERVREKLITEMPDFKPLVKSVKCDLPNGIWLELMEEEERWLLLSENGEIKGLFNNNLEGKIISFHKGNIFTSNISEEGEIVLDTYNYKITQ